MLIGELNQAVVDWPWSLVHVASGVAIGFGLIMRWSRTEAKLFWMLGLALLGGWELIEIVLRLLDTHAHQAVGSFKALVHGFAFDQESWPNIVGDMMVGSFGLWVGGALARLFRHS